MAKLSLKDVAPKTVTVTIDNTEMGYKQDIDLRLPTLQEWQDVNLSIEWPTPPKFQKMIDGKKQDVVDHNDPEYLKLRAAADELLAIRRVTQALLAADNFPELADMSLEDATDKLFEIADRSLFTACNLALVRLMSGMNRGVEAKKANFRGNSLHASGDADSDANGERPLVVEKTE